jgi:glycosyltransferase involved in cell wall biosynthesis
MSDYKFTVIMPNYNNAKYMRQAIDSVLFQKTNFPYQIIISDDQSTDGSVDIIKDYADKHPHISPLFSQDSSRQGIFTNIVKCYGFTKTDYFCVLDMDDYWTDPNRLQRAYDFFQSNPDYTIFFTNILCVNEIVPSLKPYKWFRRSIKEANFSKDNIMLGKDITIPQSSGAFFRNIVFKQGIPDIIHKARGTISEISFRGDSGRFLMHLKYGKAKYINRVESVFRIRKEGLWNSLCEFEKAISNAQIYIDYNDFYQDKSKDLFISSTYRMLASAINSLKSDILRNHIDNLFFEMIINVVKKINKNRDSSNLMFNSGISIDFERDKLKLKDIIRLKAFESLYKQLKRKKLI